MIAKTELEELEHEFDAIRPYNDSEVKPVTKRLLADKQFNKLMNRMIPWLPRRVRNWIFRMALVRVDTTLKFQKRFMKPAVNYVISKYTRGVTFDHDCIQAGEERYTFMSNHRDIVLDSAFLDVMLVEGGYPTTVEIGIGDNLLIYPWIKRLVRMNKAFTVRRGLSPKETLRSSQLMSRYIHHAVTEKKENIWIAQREGRAKDSDDRTQEAVLKMLAMGSDERQPADKLRDLNIVPLTISYEYDPCDYLKAQEFQSKRDNPAFKKSRQDDLDNMKTGIFGYKGRVVYRAAAPVNTWIDELADLPKTEFYSALSERMDREIHRGYEIYPNNYIAADELEGSHHYESHYTAADKQRFDDYLAAQLAKINLPQKDEAFLRERMLTMYANPLRNYLKVTQSQGE